MRNPKPIALFLVAAGAAAAGFFAGARPTDHATAAPTQTSALAPPTSPEPKPALEGKAGDNGQPNRFTHFRVGNKNVKSLYVDGALLWVATTGGLVRYDTHSDEYKLFDISTGLLSNGIFFVGRIKGALTVGTYGGGMSVLDETHGTWTTYNVPDGLGDAFVYDVLESRTGDVWIATWSGVNRVRGGRFADRSAWELHTVASTKGGLPNDWVYGLAEGTKGELWLATEGGMARLDQGRWENWNHARGIGADYDLVKNDIAFKSDPAKASSHHAQQKKDMGLEGVDQAYNPNYIVSLEVDKDGGVWAGTWGGGLAHWDGRSWSNLTTKDGLPGNHVFMLHRDRQDRIWIGTNNGLAVREGDHFRTLRTDDGLFSNTVFSMATTADGSMWIGSYGGVAHLRPESSAR